MVFGRLSNAHEQERFGRIALKRSSADTQGQYMSQGNRLDLHPLRW